jgi:hypothetical protein
MEEESVKISCPVFQRQEPEIKALTDKINKAKGVSEKAGYAEELQKEVGVLLRCDAYDEARLDCKNCHTIANLRKAAAGLIIKAKKLEHKKD